MQRVKKKSNTQYCCSSLILNWIVVSRTSWDFFIARSFDLNHNKRMKIKNTHEGVLTAPAVAAEIEALYMEIESLKKIVNANKDVLHDLLEVLKNAEIPYRN
jgi:hypothetical protein